MQVILCTWIYEYVYIHEVLCTLHEYTVQCYSCDPRNTRFQRMKITIIFHGKRGVYRFWSSLIQEGTLREQLSINLKRQFSCSFIQQNQAIANIGHCMLVYVAWLHCSRDYWKWKYVASIVLVYYISITYYIVRVSVTWGFGNYDTQWNCSNFLNSKYTQWIAVYISYVNFYRSYSFLKDNVV